MNQKTEPRSPVGTSERKSEFTPGFVRWMVTLTILTLAFVFLNNFVFVRFGLPEITPIPWATAGGLIVKQGLTLFSGGTPEVPSLAIRLGILFGLLLAFVLGPTAFFFSWRKLTLERQEGAVRPANIGFILGGVVLLFYVLSVGLGSIVQHKSFVSMQSAQELGGNRDGIIAGLSRVSLDAYQYKILPRSMGGGGGSYSGYDIPEPLRKSDAGTVQIVSVSDSAITLSGTSARYTGASMKAVYGPNGTMTGPFEFQGVFR